MRCTLWKLWSFRKFWPFGIGLPILVYVVSFFELNGRQFDQFGQAFGLFVVWVGSFIACVLAWCWITSIRISDGVRQDKFLKVARQKMDQLMADYPAVRNRYLWSSWHGQLWGLYNTRYAKEASWPVALKTRCRYWVAVGWQLIEITCGWLINGIMMAGSLAILVVVCSKLIQIGWAMLAFAVDSRARATWDYIGVALTAWAIAVAIEALWKWADPITRWQEFNGPVEIIFDASSTKR